MLLHTRRLAKKPRLARKPLPAASRERRDLPPSIRPHNGSPLTSRMEGVIRARQATRSAIASSKKKSTRFDFQTSYISLSPYVFKSPVQSNSSPQVWMPIYPVPSEFERPPPRIYLIPSFETMPEGSISENEKRQLVGALQTHRLNTISELRRAERSLATIDSADVSEPMTSAWTYYVNYHGLLTELRSLTRNYPFSSDCVEEAKRRVYSDPNSNRSWNLAWLVLTKIQSDQLISYYARYQASQPAMWGNQAPTADGVAKLASAFVSEWNFAVSQLLRYWERPPVSR